MEISSSAFLSNGSIPSKYGYHSGNISPPLEFNGIPAVTLSLALVCHDPDAPREGGFSHWLIWNIMPNIKEIKENSVPEGAVLGTTGWGENDWGGPAPPSGTHRYIFTLYALSVMLDLPPSANEKRLLEEIEPYIIDAASIIGMYSAA